MIARLPKRLSLTQGEQSVCIAYLGVAFFGAGIAYLTVNQLAGGNTVFRPLSLYDLWIVFAGAFGACVGLYLAGDWMGRPGLNGIGRAFVGMVLVSFIGALAAGTLALPFYGTMFGPFTFLVTLIGAPVLAAFWVAILMSAHVLLTIWHNERDTIFAMPQDDQYV